LQAENESNETRQNLPQRIAHTKGTWNHSSLNGSLFHQSELELGEAGVHENSLRKAAELRSFAVAIFIACLSGEAI